MSRVKPYKGSSSERLQTLINASRRQGSDEPIYEAVDYTFGVIEGFEDSWGRNTRILLTPTQESTYTLEQHIFYRRLPLTVLYSSPVGEVLPVAIASLPFTIHDILETINEALGLDLEPAEVIDQEFTEPQARYALRIANSHSLAWIDSNYTFEAAIADPRIHLRYVITSEPLPGFVLSGLNLNRTTDVLFLELVNHGSNRALVASDLVVDPASNTGGLPNSRVLIGASPSSTKYYGEVTRTYNRISLFDAIAGQSLDFLRNPAHQTTIDLLPQINTRYGLALQADDIVDEYLPSMPIGSLESKTISLSIQSGNWVFTGSVLLSLHPDLSLIPVVGIDAGIEVNELEPFPLVMISNGILALELESFPWVAISDGSLHQELESFPLVLISDGELFERVDENAYYDIANGSLVQQEVSDFSVGDGALVILA